MLKVGQRKQNKGTNKEFVDYTTKFILYVVMMDK